MTTYTFGPLTVEVQFIGFMPPPWSGRIERRYNLHVYDRHGHSFEAGWSNERSEKETARLIVSLLAYAKSEGREWDFYGGYRGEERVWRREQADRIKQALKEFREEEIYRAGGIAQRQASYENDRGPKDWSPTQELPE